MWDQWKTVECTKTCGGGEEFITRNIKTEAAHGGRECIGNSTIIQKCNVEECPGNNTKIETKTKKM